MINVHPLPGAEAVPPSIDDSEVLATEFLLNHPREALRLQIAVAVLAVLIVGGADWLAVYHVMSLKFVDAMGQPIGDTAGLVAMSSVTLVAYLLLAALIARREQMAKAAAVVVYLIVLVLLGTAIAPAEISNLREVWASVAGSVTFGSNAADEAPAWFVVPCLVVLAVAFSLFGMVFLLAKAWLSRLLRLWQLRDRAEATLAHAKEARARAEEARALAAFIATLETPEMADASRKAALRRGFEVYRAGITDRATALQAALADVTATKAEKQRLAALLADAGACLKSIPATP